jgi:hypothetical protein
MTASDVDLVRAAFELRLSDVPECGFLLDNEPADDTLYPALHRLKDDGLLERASDLTYDTAYLTPTAAGLTRLGLKEQS